MNIYIYMIVLKYLVVLWHYAYIYIYIYIYTIRHICDSLSIGGSSTVYINVHICTLCVYIHMYIYIYIHTYVYIFIYIYIHTHVDLVNLLWTWRYDMLWFDVFGWPVERFLGSIQSWSHGCTREDASARTHELRAPSIEII